MDVIGKRRWVGAVLGLGLAWSVAARGVAEDVPRESKPVYGNPTTYINEMLRAAWSEAKIAPSPGAPEAEFMRRVYLDLLGRIPSIEEASEFLGSKDKDKREKLVAALLEHPDYAKNFGNIWRVQLVGRRGVGNQRQVDREALGNWMRRQFSDNRPWNEVVRDLITASGSNKENGAVNFITAHLGERLRGEQGGYSAVNLTSYTTRLFLGQQIQCTQCHDHPTNDWKQADFWSINAFFRGVRERDLNKTNSAGAEVYDHTEVRDVPTQAWSKYEKRNAIVGIAFPVFLDGSKISQGEDVERREALAGFVTDPKNIQLARAFVNRMWGHLMGRGFVQPVDDLGDHNPPSCPELLDRLAKDFQASNYNIKKLITWITASEAYQLSSVSTKQNERDEVLFSHMQLKPMTPEQLFDSLLVATAAHKAGGSADIDRRRDQWLNQFLFAFGNDDGEEGTSFQGTIPQALMMMNGELIATATGGKPGSLLARIRDQSLKQNRESPPAHMARLLYLAALSRPPTPAELKRCGGFLASSPDTLQVLEDLFWALLNSNEFVLNH